MESCWLDCLLSDQLECKDLVEAEVWFARMNVFRSGVALK